jgi:hypothetical protein
MNCSLPGCNASHRAFVHTPGNSDPQPFCGPHALEALTKVAPVIDINTRKRVAMNWKTRYASGSPDYPNLGRYPEDFAKKINHTYETDNSASHTTWKLHEPVGRTHGIKITQKYSNNPELKDWAEISTHYLDNEGKTLSKGPSGIIAVPSNKTLQHWDQITGNHEQALVSAVKALHS